MCLGSAENHTLASLLVSGPTLPTSCRRGVLEEDEDEEADSGDVSGLGDSDTSTEEAAAGRGEAVTPAVATAGRL